MRKDSAGRGNGSTTPTWEALEGFVREKAQELIQEILEQEVRSCWGGESRNGRRPRTVRKAIGTGMVGRGTW